MDGIKRNLARTWRSSQFDEIVGQNLAVRILKNSLFLDQYFPVYLFAGQRGCGKTSMARLFAASLNCEKLPVFQQQPKSVVLPCRECRSCRAMKDGSHPDYIEIDAASHTGVDNVRQIIDAASLLPVFGGKKIYLIDEAHMLSKAAFNAFLKILEEPPMSVIFILATTDMYKIIDTVRSRSFHIFFKPIAPAVLTDHLEYICQQEKIPYHKDGLAIIARQTDGSARDALNLLEQVRFSTEVVTEAAVLEVLGYVSDAHMLQMFEYVIANTPESLLEFLRTLPFSDYNPAIVWQQFSLLVRSVLWVSYRLEAPGYAQHASQLEHYAQRVSSERLTGFLQLMYQHELLFFKTTAQHDMFEMVLLLMCNAQRHGSINVPVPSDQAVPLQKIPMDSAVQQKSSAMAAQPEIAVLQTPWQQVVTALNQKNNFMMQSVFHQMKFHGHDQQTGHVSVSLGQQYAFFKGIA